MIEDYRHEVYEEISGQTRGTMEGIVKDLEHIQNYIWDFVEDKKNDEGIGDGSLEAQALLGIAAEIDEKISIYDSIINQIKTSSGL